MASRLPYRANRQAAGGIATQHGVVAIGPTRDLVLGLDELLVDDVHLGDTSPRIQHDHVRISDELEEVPVAGDDADPSRRALSERADDVLGLVAGMPDDLDP